MKVASWNQVQKVLTVQAESFLRQAYDLKLEIPIVINSRLKSTYGRFIHAVTRKESLRIEIGKNYIENQEWNTILETLVHECIHHALYELDMPYKDGQATFERELKKHGSHSTGTVKYHGKVVQYECPTCGTTYNKRKRYPKNRTYRSGCCGGIIKFIGEKVI